MDRRHFLLGSAAGVLAACAGEPPTSGPDVDAHGAGGDDGGAPPPDAATDGAACTRTITLYDTNAVALYFDGTIGPLTGVVRVADVVAAVTLPKEFWHGHGGMQHRYTVEPAHFAALRRGERVMITTTVVDDHQHMLFIDPIDPEWRVAGATPVTIAAC